MYQPAGILEYIRKPKRLFLRRVQRILFRWATKMLFDELNYNFRKFGESFKYMGLNFNQFMKMKGEDNAH